MRNALHEQLLKAGLVDEQRLQESEREKHRQQHSRGAGKPGREPPQKRAEPVKHEQRREQAPVQPGAPRTPSKDEVQAARRALEREIAQLIKANRRPHNDGDEVFNFVDGKKIGRIYVTPATQAGLTRGELAIVRLRSRYAIVTSEVAAIVAARAPEFVIRDRPSEASTEDPAYLEHPIPDDLRW